MIKTTKMKKLLIPSLVILLISCSKKEQKQVIIYDNSPFEQVRKYGEEIKADTSFSNHLEDITLPLNRSMQALKIQNPEFYAECMECSSDKELTQKLKDSDLFRKIARERGLNLSKVSLIKHLK